jgi:hypothetical protein
MQGDFEQLKVHVQTFSKKHLLTWWLICAICVFAPQPRQAKSRKLTS